MTNPRFRRALITGASTGIGLAYAERLARDGTGLSLVARDGDRLRGIADRLRKDHGADSTVLPADLTRPEDVAKIVAAVAEDPALDLLVNNAGFATLGRFAELPVTGELNEIALNVVALVRLSHAALPAMIARHRGAIINLSSLAAFQPGPYNATYTATKAYVKSFTESLAEELRGTGVSVQVVCPGFTRTEFQERAGLDATRIPSFAWMTAEEVVEASLHELQRGKVVSVPGLANRFSAALTAVVPGAILRRALGHMTESVILGRRARP